MVAEEGAAVVIAGFLSLWRLGRPAVLLKNHGVFTVGKSARHAVKAAVMVEDVARTVWYTLQIGQPNEIAPDDVAKLHYRYTHVYGQ